MPTWYLLQRSEKASVLFTQRAYREVVQIAGLKAFDLFLANVQVSVANVCAFFSSHLLQSPGSYGELKSFYDEKKGVIADSSVADQSLLTLGPTARNASPSMKV